MKQDLSTICEKKPVNTTNSYMKRIQNFEKFLTEKSTPLEDATVADLKEFAEWCKKRP